MAEPIVRSFVIDTTESEQNLKELNVQINATSTAINQGAQSFENVAAAEETVVASSKSLKAQLRDLQAQLAATEPNSEKYRQLSQAAGELKDKIQDAAQAVGTQAGGAFERVSGSLGLVTSRIANLDFEGAAEGAKLLAQNITQIKPGDIAKGIQSIGSAFASVGKALLTNPIFLIGAAIAAAIVYADELLSLIDGVTDAETEALNKQKERAALAKEQYDIIGEQEESLKRQGLTEEEILKKKLEALDAAILEQEIIIETTKTQAKAQVEAAKRNADYLRGFLEFVTLPQRKLAEFFQGFVNGAIKTLNFFGAEIEQVNFTKVFDDVNDFLTKKIFDPAQVEKDGAAAVKEAEKANRQLKAQRDQLLNNQEAKEKAAREKANADAKAAADKKLAEEKAALDKQYAAQKDYYDKVAALEDEKYKETLTKEEQEELAIVQKYEALFAAADAANQSTIDLQKQLNAELAALDAQRTANAQAEADKRKSLEDDFFNSYKGLQNEFIAAEDERYFNSLNNTEQEELRITQKYEALFAKADAAGKDTTKLQKELSEKIKEIQDKAAAGTANSLLEQFNKGIELAGQSLNAFNSLADTVFSNRMSKVKKGSKEEEALAKKQFKFQKASQIAAATIDTAKAITAAISANPFPSPTLPIAISLASVTGAAQIAKIAATKFESGGSTTPDTTTPSVGGGGAESQPAQFNPLASSFLQERPEQITPRAYVLASDVASAAEVRENVADLARIG